MILLVMIKDNKTKYHLCNNTIYGVGDTTSSGWDVIDKGYYYRGTFLSYKDMEKEYWEVYRTKSKYKKSLVSSFFSKIFK